ncbi:hypothetical protein S40285_10599 [Stachybotrys chlorohalonatus IBT 40285]|uniref:Uncharacterized protein n=1 Tax=Stachybotrys chlorohalonatus (strain IBT 40285) TaxID=1283841 RepID=A0A084Q918_STAC4|nr:hypothetical protein S40285_10599 [Stachybotrys chlorohalonata IBT 40285]
MGDCIVFRLPIILTVNGLLLRFGYFTDCSLNPNRPPSVPAQRFTESVDELELALEIFLSKVELLNLSRDKLNAEAANYFKVEGRPVHFGEGINEFIAPAGLRASLVEGLEELKAFHDTLHIDLSPGLKIKPNRYSKAEDDLEIDDIEFIAGSREKADSEAQYGKYLLYTNVLPGVDNSMYR